MKTILTLAFFLTASMASAAIQISGGEIAAKTDLVTSAERTVNGSSQLILVDASGFTLYTFELDKNGFSACLDVCLKVWPPLHSAVDAVLQAPFGTTQGNDGKAQLTLNGAPLYYYNRDKKAGDVFGEYPNWNTVRVTTGLHVSSAAIADKSSLVKTAERKVNGIDQTILVDALGLSLYTFAKDQSGLSKCTGNCLKVWPPLHVPINSIVEAPFATIQGNDGLPQLTLNGLPLYYYIKDLKAGDVFGQYPGWDSIAVVPESGGDRTE